MTDHRYVGPPRTDTERGLYGKYEIYHREDGRPIDGPAFVLRPDRDRAARAALVAYSVTTENEALAADLQEWLQTIKGGPFVIDTPLAMLRRIRVALQDAYQVAGFLVLEVRAPRITRTQAKRWRETVLLLDREADRAERLIAHEEEKA